MSVGAAGLPEQSLPVLALKLEDAAAALSMSVEFFNGHVRPEVRVVRIGRTKRVPVSELQRWLDDNAAYAVER